MKARNDNAFVSVGKFSLLWSCALCALLAAAVGCGGTSTGAGTNPPPPAKASPPAVAAINPSSGPPNGGTTVSISGTGFQAGATVLFGSATASNVSVVNASTINATTPSSSPGTVGLTVRNPDGQSSLLPSAFTYSVPIPPAVGAPVISSITPASGTSNGGTSVTIAGSNFGGGTSVTIGGSSLTNLIVQSTTSITGDTPAHVAGGGDVVVTNPGGQSATLGAMLHNQGFESLNAEWVASGSGAATIVNNVNNAHVGTSYAELSSPVKGDHPILYAADSNGSPRYFPVNPGDVITFGGWAYRVSGDGPARWVIEVSDANKANPVFLSAPPANVQDQQWELQQGTYTVAGGQAFIRLFCEVFGNTVAAVVRFDDAILQRSPGGTYGYNFISPPMVNSVSPNWGTPAGGTTRTVFGTGFVNGDMVTVDGTAATNVVVNNANAITFFVPPHAAGNANVTVTSPDSQTSATEAAYTYQAAPAAPAGMTNIHHIIFSMQENRSFDNYFGVMNQYRANNGVNDNAVDDLNLNQALPDIAGQMIKPFHLTTECVENTQPSWNATHMDYDNGKMDLFMKTGNMFATSSTIDPNGTRAVGYYDSTDLPYYYSLGFQFAISDKWYSSMMGPTGPNRAYSFAGTSLGFIGTPQPPNGGTFPNFTIFDLLDQGGVSWKYYYQNATPTWIPVWSVYTRDQSKVVPISEYYSDVTSDSTLPQVVFIEENGNMDEHPKPDPGTIGFGQNIQDGANLMSQIIGALMGSPAWSSSVFILTWDEGGGIHDHSVPPAMPLPDGYPPQTTPSQDQPGIFNQAGLRVPLIVVSPWTGPHQVSHTVRDHTSILKLIETRFGLPPLTGRDAAADNMLGFFNFQAPPWLTPPPVCSGGNTNACLQSQPTTGTCDLNLEKAPGQ